MWKSLFHKHVVTVIFFVPYILMTVFVVPFAAHLSVNLRFCLFLLLFVSWALGAGIYYYVFIAMSRKIHEIEMQYDLNVSVSVENNWIEQLEYILDMIDHTLDREYSNSIMRKQAEFDQMKSQINPHFLYNTLDSVRGYALIEHAPIAADMIERLSRIFRYSISQGDDLIRLQDELNMVDDYIAIQMYRNSGKIVVKRDIQDFLLKYKIPKLIIQPFIENSIKHGMKDILSDFVIKILVYATDTRLIISVKDNGCGMDAGQLVQLNEMLYRNAYGRDRSRMQSGKGSGIAVANVNARIKLLFGDQFGVVAYSSPGMGSEFQISLPYIPKSGGI